MPNNIKSWFWGFFTLLLAVIIIGVVFYVIPAVGAFGNSFTPARTITVSAQGMTTATPDLAEITFSTVTTGSNPTNLQTNDDMKSGAVAQFLSSEKIASSDITTTGYDLSPNYQYDQTSQRNFITGYTLTDTTQVKIHDLTQVATILGGLAPLGVNQIGGVVYTFNDPDSLLVIARGQAMTNAREKAGELAGEAGVSLGKVINVNESGNVIVPGPLPYAEFGAGSSAAMAPVPTVNPGTQNITDNVTITYQIN